MTPRRKGFAAIQGWGFDMPYSGKGPGPLWARAIYSGALMLTLGVLLCTGPLWIGPVSGTGWGVVEGMGLFLASIGVVAIFYGFRWRRRGFDDTGMAMLAQERMDRIQATLQKDEAVHRPKTK